MIVAYTHTHTHLMLIDLTRYHRWSERKGLSGQGFLHYLKWELVETTDLAHIFIISTLPRIK